MIRSNFPPINLCLFIINYSGVSSITDLMEMQQINILTKVTFKNNHYVEQIFITLISLFQL